MTELDAIDLIETLAAAFPKQRVEPKTIDIYARMIQQYDRPDAEAAILYLIATATFFPAVAEIRNAIAEGQSTLSHWEESWDTLCQIRKRHGSYVGPQWGNTVGFDPLTDQALRIIGGYEAFCAVQFEDEPTMRAQFRDAYNNLRKRQINRAATDGVIEAGRGVALGEGR